MEKKNIDAKPFRKEEVEKIMEEIERKLEEYMDTIGKYIDKISRLENEILEIAKEERYCKTVDRICCLKGINRISALTFVCEIGDVSRFESAKVFPAYLGLVPGDHSSGGKPGKLGITKLGNSALRRLAVECARAAVRGIPGSKPKKLSERQKGCDVKTVSYADRGTERMQRRYLPYHAERTGTRLSPHMPGNMSASYGDLHR